MSPDGSLQVLSVDMMGPVEQVRDSVRTFQKPVLGPLITRPPITDYSRF